MGKLRIIRVVPNVPLTIYKVDISSNLIRTIVSTIGQGDLRKGAQESAMDTTNSVTAVKY